MFNIVLNDVHGGNVATKMTALQMVNKPSAEQRRSQLKDAFATAAERAIQSQGLHALRARALAEEVGCAVGGIYNVVDDLDELVLLVNSRTLAVLEREIEAAIGKRDDVARSPDESIARLVRLALAYL